MARVVAGKGNEVIKFVSMPLLAVLACLVPSTGCARQSEGPADSTEYWRRVANALQASNELRERALAAQLLALGGKGGSAMADDASLLPGSGNDALARRLVASVQTSDDAVALSVAAQAGAASGDKALVATSTRRWQALEPDNLAPLLFSATPAEELLIAARGATRYESHGYAHVRLMSATFERVPMVPGEISAKTSQEYPTPELRAGVSAFAIWAAQGFPSLRTLTDACKNDALESTPTRRVDCLHVARTLARHSDNMLTTSVGIGMLRRAADTPEDQALANALDRNNAWQQHKYYEVLSSGRRTIEEMEETMRLLHAPGIESEIQLREAALLERGIPLVPPAEWKAPSHG
ncbi:MAG: hypothetical protein EOP92_02900 [Lysobacteraceae bacterium]|nr:MAG: hypothetical protein EOP92_02900 [Xanthomonadaceae bacterium]